MKIQRINHRHSRARTVTAHIMQAIEKHMPDDDHNDLRRKLTYEIHAALMIDGIEVLTEFDRAQLGLPPRGPDGWTDIEIAMHDSMMRDAMLRTMHPVHVLNPAQRRSP